MYLATSQEELAERVALSRDYIIDFESAKGIVCTARLYRTLHELGIPMVRNHPSPTPNRELFLYQQRFGTIETDGRDKTRVALNVDTEYREGTLVSESFARLPGRREPTNAVLNFLCSYVPGWNHREAMTAKRRIDNDNLRDLLRE